MNPKGRPRIDPNGERRKQKTIWVTDSEWRRVTDMLDTLRLNISSSETNAISQQHSDDEFIG